MKLQTHIKEIIMKKETKIRLTDIDWAYTADGSTVSPYIINKQGTRYKNILTDDIYTFNRPIQNPRATTFDTEVALENEIRNNSNTQETSTPEQKINVFNSNTFFAKTSFALGFKPAFSNDTLFRLNLYITNDRHKTIIDQITEFCSSTCCTKKEVKKLTKYFSKSLKDMFQEKQKDFLWNGQHGFLLQN